MDPAGKSFISIADMLITKLSSFSVTYDVVIQLSGAFFHQTYLSIKEDMRCPLPCKQKQVL